ncbi:hypothetical protein Glove_645g12 [Diversispora epigaea]|uniref:CHCH domain-containing protein n=1 Tax=Diversispora epigaea TaxID=1348612 RepID=A0A397G8A8_9GLOM|nr:hypothetical protein Glove_645g12 [Diversispora epigaea]
MPRKSGSRSRSSSRSSSRSTPNRTSTSTSKTPTPVKAAPTPIKAAPTPVKATPTPTPVASSTNVPSKTSTPSVPAPTPSSAPGFLGQVASTAAGVAIGSTISRGVSSLFSGSNEEGSTDSGGAPLPAQERIPPQSLYNDNNDSPFQSDDFGNNGCQTNARDLVKCLEQNNNDINVCQWYLDSLKACQQMASQL